MPSRFDPDGVIGRTVVLAVINRLQQWCCKLLWFTIVCVMGCCGDLKKINNESQTMSDVRRTIVTAQKVNRSANTKTVLELEMQLLRHLTSPQTAVLRPTKPANKHQLSRPPSPQLFDICEDDENLH
uniref:Uncharacterized protein n=1 Tax=Panagrellus redivivus TaxID=6233 RepID=A0A7E4V3H8_PANRE